MASISKKISETDYERIGDTQGLVIPRDRLPDWDSGEINVPANNTSNIMTHGLNTALSELDITISLRRAADGAWFTVRDQFTSGRSSTNSYGFVLFNNGTDSFNFRVAAHGLEVLDSSGVQQQGGIDKLRIKVWKKTERLIYIGGPKGLRETWARFKLNDADILGSGGGVTFSNFTILQKEGPGAQYLPAIGQVFRFTAPYKGKLDVMVPMFCIDVIPDHYGAMSLVNQFTFGSPSQMRKWNPDRKTDQYSSFPGYDVWGILNAGDPFIYTMFSGYDFRIEWQRWGYNSADDVRFGWWELYFHELVDVDL
jgi:hypothetical protein